MTNSADRKQKKRVVVSYKNLSAELREEVKKKYPNGYTDSMIRIDKGPGDFFYAIARSLKGNKNGKYSNSRL